MYKIAIDGPSGAGKSSVAKALAARLGIIYVDTGALYRAVGLFVCERGIGSTDAEKITALLSEIKVELRFEGGAQKVFLCGRDVSGEIRTNTISKYASDVSAIPAVRAFLLDTQRDIAKKNSVIMDGRDIGTVILPDAEVKIFLIASPEARARRRVLELREKGQEVGYEETFAAMVERDRNDSSRDIAPLRPAEDAVTVDNSDIDLDGTIERILQIIKDKTGD